MYRCLGPIHKDRVIKLLGYHRTPSLPGNTQTLPSQDTVIIPQLPYGKKNNYTSTLSDLSKLKSDYVTNKTLIIFTFL